MSIAPNQAVRPINRLLKIAVVGGVEVAVKLHIARGDDLDSRDDRGLTPLMLAAARNKASICQLLIDAGVDLRALDPSGRDALAVARAAEALDSALMIEAALAHRVAQVHQIEPGAQHVAAPDNDRLGEQSSEHAFRVNGNARASSPMDAVKEQSEAPAAREHQVTQGTSSSAGVIVAESFMVAASIEPACLDEEDASALDPSGWHADEDRPPPPDNAALAADQAAIQRIIARHAPIDDSADWGHFEAFLPEHAAPLHQAEDAESTAELRRLLLRALREGSVPEFGAQDLCVGADGAPDPASLSRLRFVINDLGAETDERFEYRAPHENFEAFVQTAETQHEEDAVGDAMAFLADLESHRNDPMRLYMRDAQRKSLINAEEEMALAKAMEDAVKGAIDALASWPLGMRLTLAAIEDARMGRRPLNSITTGSRDEGEPDHGELLEGVGAEKDSAIAIAALGIEADDESEVDQGDGVAEQGAGAATETLAPGFFEQAGALFALIGSDPAQTTYASNRRVILASLALKRTLLMDLADTTGDDTSENASRFRGAVRSLVASRDRMAGANLRLVLSIAKRYLYSGLPMDDLIQEGNIGLLKAIDKFDWRRGYKFSTMATWWIRQQVSRSVADDARTIRLPGHIHDKLQRIEREAAAMARAIGREPSSAELAARLLMAPAKVDALLRAAEPPLPLDSVDSDGDSIVERIEDPHADPFEIVAARELRATLETMLSKLGGKPERVLRMRFGLALGLDDPLTLEEIGLQFDLTRERIRQIESKALKRLDQRRHREMLHGWVRGAESDKKASSGENEAPDENDEGEAPKAASLKSVAEAASKTQPRPSVYGGQSQQPSAIDRLLAQATELSIPVEDDRSGGSGSAWVSVIEAHDAPTRALVRKLIAQGFEYWPGKGYWK